MNTELMIEVSKLVNEDGATVHVIDRMDKPYVAGYVEFIGSLMFFTYAFPESDHDFHLVKVVDILKIHESGFNVIVQFGSVNVDSGVFVSDGEVGKIYMYGIESYEEEQIAEYKKWRQLLRQNTSVFDNMFNDVKKIFLGERTEDRSMQGV